MRLLLLLIASLGLSATLPQGIDGKRMVENVRLLSSELYAGRWTGSKELDQVAAWIVKEFQKDGLKAPFLAGSAKPSYLQKLVVNTESRLGKKNTLSIAGTKLIVAKDYLPRVISSTGLVDAPLAFAGYGISASDYHYDDYADLDVKGKVVLVLRYEPQDTDEKSVFLGKGRTRYASIETKAINAKMHGATAMILINNSVTHPAELDKLDNFGNESGALAVGIPVLQVKASIANQWFEASGHALPAIVAAIDSTMKPQSFLFPKTYAVKMHVEVDHVMKPTNNVAAFLPGLSDEYIVVGAHYDHLGLGRQFSMSPSEAGKIHPGADDNASGTSAVLELARYFSTQPKQKRGILFATFTGEELGLLGSSHMASHMPFPLANCVAMVNLDMVGRMRDGKLFIAGIGTGSTFKGILDDVLARDNSINPDLSENLNIGGSDHTSFSTKQIPTLFFFSGLHTDYHKPSDTFEKFVAADYARLVTLVAATVEGIVNAPDRPEFRRIEPPVVPSGGNGGSSSGYGPYFGSIPDFAEHPDGVRLADIRAGSPAEKGGVLAGDVLIEFDGKKVSNLQDYTFLLRSKHPGDVVAIKVKRLENTITLSVVLEARK